MPSTPEPEVVQEPGQVWRVRGLGGVGDVHHPGALRRAVERVRARAADAGVRVLSIEVAVEDAELAALVSSTRVLGLHLEKQLDPGVVGPTTVGWRSLTTAELGPWSETQVRAYAEDNLERSGGDAALALERSRTDVARLLPDGLQTPDTSLVALTTTDAGRIGHLWVRHHQQPGLSYVFDVEVDERHRGHGFGRAAMVLAEVLAVRAGDERIGLHVFGANETARRLYLTQGYVVRSTTHDLLAKA